MRMWRGGRPSWLFMCMFVCILAVPGVVRAAGFALYEYSARGNAMGGALAATQRPDASAIAFNPATLALMSKPQAVAGVTFITPSATVVRNGVDQKLKDQTFAVPHAYYVQPVNEDVVLGIGEFTRFGLGTKYPYDWAGAAKMYDVLFESYSVAPTVAFRCSDALSIGVGLEVMKAGVDIWRHITFGGSDFDMHLQSEGVAIGANISALYKFNEEWAAGLVIRTPMDLYGSGSVSYSGTRAAPFNAYQEGGMSMTTTLPDSYTLAVSWTPNERFSVEAGATFTRWEQYNNFNYDFDNNPPADTTDWKYWRNVWRLNVGLEYWAMDWLALRAGYVWDQEPIRDGHEDYMVTANDRQLVTGGLGFKWDDLTLDLSYQFLWARDRDNFAISEPFATPNVSFKNNRTHLIGATVGYTF
ncbi:OmpP1/FadL family transporter [Desulfovibrio aminophilus]|uniref:OmpP1/FadL family transporter n=1 Tax=Desulfovibrio aminophilus TaxID=81425 RepID=UPI000404953D|nr:outer membrane protein transport protein [Desulfovibrio aminophilus]